MRHHYTSFPAAPQDGGDELPLFRDRSRKRNNQDIPKTRPPNLVELSGQSQARAKHFSVTFVRWLFMQPDRSGQASVCRLQKNIPGSKAIGVACRDLHQRGITKDLGFGISPNPQRKAGVERIWAIDDENMAIRFLTANGASNDPPTNDGECRP